MSSDSNITPGRLSNKGKPHRPRSPSEPGEIYLVRNKVNGKLYVGQVFSLSCTGAPYGTHCRWIGHVGDAKAQLEGKRDGRSRGCRALNSEIIKHGKESFEVEVLLKCGSDQLDHYEARFIDMHKSLARNGRGYNLKSGGNGNGRADELTRLLMSEARRGEKHHQYGKARTEATKAKISATLQNVVRMDFDGSTRLPHGMKTQFDSGRVGYVIIRHALIPNGGRTEFTTSTTSAACDPELVRVMRARCVFYLDYLNRCAALGVVPASKKDVITTFVMSSNELTQL